MRYATKIFEFLFQKFSQSKSWNVGDVNLRWSLCSCLIVWDADAKLRHYTAVCALIFPHSRPYHHLSEQPDFWFGPLSSAKFCDIAFHTVHFYDWISWFCPCFTHSVLVLGHKWDFCERAALNCRSDEEQSCVCVCVRASICLDSLLMLLRRCTVVLGIPGPECEIQIV